MTLKMDSRTPAEPRPDADQNLAIQILKVVAPPAVAKDYEDRLRAGGLPARYGRQPAAQSQEAGSLLQQASPARAFRERDHFRI